VTMYSHRARKGLCVRHFNINLWTTIWPRADIISKWSSHKNERNVPSATSSLVNKTTRRGTLGAPERGARFGGGRHSAFGASTMISQGG
jgi:hypothetical protein